MDSSVLLCAQTPLNLINLLERALQVLSRSQPHVRAAKQVHPGPATQSEAEGLLGSILLLMLAVKPMPCIHITSPLTFTPSSCAMGISMFR